MKKSIFTGKNSGVITLVLCFVLANAAAQKLPNVQKTSLRAPAGIKIDGVPTEWNNTFQANNHSTNVFYTIANDENNLYLVIQSITVHTVEKILSGGITLTLNAGNKDKSLPVAITYPLLPPKDRSAIVSKVRSETTNMEVELPDMNKQLTNNSKEIKIKGIEAIPDTLISVYNENGIKAAALLNNHKAYTYELALPLKYLQQLTGITNKLNYNIKLNGLMLKVVTIRINGVSPDISSHVVVNGGTGNSELQDLTSPTDFSGIYILAK